MRGNFADFIRELKRRRVFRVAAAYLVAGWIVIQVAATIVPALHLPAAFVTGITVVALLGLPIALALAWAFDLTATGVRRDQLDTAPSTLPQTTSLHARARLALMAVVLLVTAAAIAIAWRRSTAAPGRAEPGEQARTIAIMPFAVRGSGPVAHMGSGMVDLLSTDLTRTGELQVVDPHALLAAIGDRYIDPDAARNLARQFNAGMYVLGSVVEAAGRVRLTASLYERSRGARPIQTYSADGAVADIIALAREIGTRLAAGVPPLDATSLRASLLWSGPDVDASGTVSSDGRWLSFTDWVTGDLAVRDLVAGTNRRLTDKGPWSQSDEFAEYSTISRDGRRIAYSWSDESYRYRLRVVSRDGSEDRLVYSAEVSGEEVGWLMPFQWSPDGNSVLIQHWVANETTARWIDVRDGSARTVARFGTTAPGRLLVSPDGRWLAFTLPQARANPRHDIYVMPADGGQWTPIVQSPAHDELLAWSPDGGHLLFWSDRGATPGIWSAPVSNGVRTAEPRLVRADMWWLWPVGFAGGDFLYEVAAREVQVHRAEIDLVTARLVSNPVRAAHETAPTTVTPLFEPGGSRLAFIVESPRGQRGAGVLAVLQPATGAVVEYPLGITYPRATQWLLDGRILVYGGRSDETFGYYTVDLATGAILRYDLGKRAVQNLVISRDGRTQFFTYWPAATRFIIRRDVRTGREQILLQDSAGGGLALSRDERTLYFAQRRAGQPTDLRAMPASGGASRVVHRLPPDQQFSSFRVTDDEQHILYVRTPVDTDEPPQLWVFTVADGTDRHVITLDGLRSLQLHPDGRQILFATGESRTEIWKLAGVAQSLK